MLVKDLPIPERPREKALKYGIKSLSSRELLAIWIRCGYAGCSSLQIADKVLAKANGLARLNELTITDLEAISGIKKVKAIELLAVFELSKRCTLEKAMRDDYINEPANIIQWLEKEIGDSNQEQFMALFLNIRNQIIDYKILFIGDIQGIFISPREIFREALLSGACKLIVVHNHPSQAISPSGEDLKTTTKLKEAGQLMGVILVDHLIVTKNEYYSFKESGFL